MEEEVLVIKIIARGCPLNASAESFLRVDTPLVAKGELLPVVMEYDFQEETRPTMLEVLPNEVLGIAGAEVPVEEDEVKIDLELETDRLPLGTNQIEAVLEQDQYHTTVSESNRQSVNIASPKINIESFRVVDEQPSPDKNITCKIGLKATSGEKIKGGIALGLRDRKGEVIEVEETRMALVGQGEFVAVVPKGFVDWGDYDVTVKVVQKGEKPVVRTFQEALAVRPDTGLEIVPVSRGSIKVTQGEKRAVGFMVKNIGRWPAQVYLEMITPKEGRDFTLGSTNINVVPGEESEVKIESFVPPEFPKGFLNYRLEYEIAGKKTSETFPESPIEVTDPHVPNIVSCVCDMDFYSPGDLVVIRAYLEDQGAEAGGELEVSLKVKDDKVRFSSSVITKIGADRTLVQFEWVTPEKLRTGKLSVELSVLEVKKNFKNLIQIEEPIVVRPKFISPHAGKRTRKRYKGRPNVLVYLYEDEEVVDGKEYRFVAGGKKRLLEVFTLDSRTKLLSIDGRVIFGLDWRKQDTRVVFDSLFSYLALTRLEHPGFVKGYNTMLSYLGRLGLGDIVNCLEALKPGSGKGVGVQDWEKGFGTARKKAVIALKGFDGKFLTLVPVLDKELRRGLNLKKSKAVDNTVGNLEKGLQKLLKRDLDGYKEMFDGCLKKWTMMFNEDLDFKSGEIEPGDAHVLFIKHLLVMWLAIIPLIIELKKHYLRIQAFNYLDRKAYVDMLRDRVYLHLLLAQRYNLQSSLDPYTPPDENRRAVLDNLEIVKRCNKNAVKAFEMTLDLQKNYVKNKDHRNRLANLKRNVSVNMDRTAIKGKLGGRSREKASLVNIGPSTVSVVVTTALPNEEWTLVEPVSSISKDVYISQEIDLPPMDEEDLFLSFNMPKGLDLRSYKLLFYISSPYKELSPLLDRSLEDEPRKLQKMVLPAVKLGGVGKNREKVGQLLDDYFRIRFVQKRAQVSALPRKERGLFQDGKLILHRYDRLMKMKDDSFFGVAKATGFFDIGRSTIEEGVVFKKKVESRTLLIKDAKDVRLEPGQVVQAGGSVYLADIATKVILDGLRRALKPGYQQLDLVGISNPYIPPTLSRDYLYERELPGTLDKYSRSSAADALTKKAYEKKLPRDRSIRFSNKLIANSLKTWVQCLIDSPPDVIRNHLLKGDFEQWLREQVGSNELANILGGFATRIDEEIKEGQVRPDEVKRLLFQRLDKTPLKLQISQSTVKPMIKKLQSGNPKAVKETLERLVEIGDPQSIDAIIEKLFDPHKETRLAAINALGEIGDKRAIPPLEKIISFTNDDKEKQRAGEVIAEIMKG